MASRNPDSLDHQGAFHARIVPSQPVGHKWHKPGNEQGKDAIPEYHAQAFPPGTAPKANTFQPHPLGAHLAEDVDTGGALDMPGATSKDVHNSIDALHGHPLQGQTSRERHLNRHERAGLEGVGASPREGTVESKVRHLAADKENVERGLRGYSGRVEGGLAAPGAEDQLPITADSRDIKKGPKSHHQGPKFHHHNP